MSYVNKSPLGDVVMRVNSMPETWVIDNAKQRKLLTTATLDAVALAERLEREAGVTYSVARIYGFEPAPNAGSSREQIKTYSVGVYNQIRAFIENGGSRNVHLQVNCEHGPSHEQLYMYVELMELAVKDPNGPIGMVFSNGATGSFPSGNYGEPNYWATAPALAYIATLDKYRKVRLRNGSYAFIHGTHAYTSQYPNIAYNGGETKGNPQAWRSNILIDWSKPQDHLARDFQAMMMALQYKPNGSKWEVTQSTIRRSDGSAVEPPWFIVTEELIDNMNDVANVHNDLVFYPPYSNPWGYNSMRRQWETVWYKDLGSAGRILGKMRKWVWENVYASTGYYIGTHNFCMGDTGGWYPHNTLLSPGNPDVDYYQSMADYAQQAFVPAHFVGVNNVAEIEKIIHTPGANVNMRNGPSTTAAIIVAIPNEARVFIFEGEVQNNWQRLRYNGQVGWVSLQAGKVTFTDPPIVVPPIDPQNFEELKALTLSLLDEVKALERLENEHWKGLVEIFENLQIEVTAHETEITNLQGVGSVPLAQIQSMLLDLQLWLVQRLASREHVKKSVKALIDTAVSDKIDEIFDDPANQQHLSAPPATT